MPEVLMEVDEEVRATCPTSRILSGVEVARNHLLPFEIIDRMLAHLSLSREDGLNNERREVKNNLGRCSLVCRRWSGLARRHLFSDLVCRIYVNHSTENQCGDHANAFLDFLRKFPYIGSCVRRLQVDAMILPVPFPGHCTCSARRDLLNLLISTLHITSNLRILQLSGFVGLANSADPVIVHIDCSRIVISLKDRRRGILTTQDILDVLGILPGKHQLELRNLRLIFDSEVDDAVPGCIHKPFAHKLENIGLKSITLCDVFNPAPFFTACRALPSMHWLRSLNVGYIPPDAVDPLSDLLCMVGPNLMHFGFDIYCEATGDLSFDSFRDHYTDVTYLFGLDVSNCTNLSSLQIGLTVLVESRNMGDSILETAKVPTTSVRLIHSFIISMPSILNSVSFNIEARAYLPWVNALDFRGAMQYVETALVLPVHSLQAVTFSRTDRRSQPLVSTTSLNDKDERYLERSLELLHSASVLRFD